MSTFIQWVMLLTVGYFGFMFATSFGPIGIIVFVALIITWIVKIMELSKKTQKKP